MSTLLTRPAAVVWPLKLCRRGTLILVTAHDEYRNCDFLEIFGEIGLRESDDAIVMRLRATHHALAPPVLDDRLGRFYARRLNP